MFVTGLGSQAHRDRLAHSLSVRLAYSTSGRGRLSHYQVVHASVCMYGSRSFEGIGKMTKGWLFALWPAFAGVLCTQYGDFC